ncbi:UNVERIFIED_CONTAM: hypothetical protein GTU68_051884 [Idotea baltica]|nr:hypothetical protein [Idotea baltica]
MISFSKAELERYSRHIILPDFNIEGQRKLKNAKVLVVGSGGLGSPVLQYLAAAGIGTLGIVDFDIVDDSNLQRQVLYGVESVGKLKVEEAKKRILSLNPHIEVRTHEVRIQAENAMEIIQDYDVVADGTDNFATRYLINDACVLANKPNVYASIFQFEGQVSVFNYTDSNGVVGPNYRDIFPSPPPPGMVPSCAEGGVLGVLPGIIGSIQALEVIKVVTGIGDPLVGRLFLFDALSFSTRVLSISKDPENPLSGESPTQHGLIDYEEFCNPSHLKEEESSQAPIKELTVQELAVLKSKSKPYLLIDVREPYEYDIVQIGGKLIPQNEVVNHLNEIPTDIPVILHCRSGVRSAKVIRSLNALESFDNLFNLKGGILAYANESRNNSSNSFR